MKRAVEQLMKVIVLSNLENKHLNIIFVGAMRRHVVEGLKSMSHQALKNKMNQIHKGFYTLEEIDYMNLPTPSFISSLILLPVVTTDLVGEFKTMEEVLSTDHENNHVLQECLQRNVERFINIINDRLNPDNDFFVREKEIIAPSNEVAYSQVFTFLTNPLLDYLIPYIALFGFVFELTTEESKFHSMRQSFFDFLMNGLNSLFSQVIIRTLMLPMLRFAPVKDGKIDSGINLIVKSSQVYQMEKECDSHSNATIQQAMKMINSAIVSKMTREELSERLKFESSRSLYQKISKHPLKK